MTCTPSSVRLRPFNRRAALAGSAAGLSLLMAAGSAMAQTGAAPGPNLICAPAVQRCVDGVLLGGIGFDQFNRSNQTHIRVGGGTALPSDFVGNRYSDVDGDRWADGSTEPYTERTIIYWDGTHGSSDWGTSNAAVGGLGMGANTSTVGERLLTSFNSFDSSITSSNSSPGAGVPYVSTDRALRLNLLNGASTAIGVDAAGYSLTHLAFSALTGAADVTINLGVNANGVTTSTGRSLTVTGAAMNNGVANSYYAFDLTGLGLDNGQFNLVMTYVAPDGTFLTIDNIQIIAVVYDPASGLMVIWQGGDGTWGASPVNWGSAGGGTGAWTQGEFASFDGAAGTVTVDTADGPVTFSGAEFLSSGYVIVGDALTTEGATIELRVSAQTAATISAAITGTAGVQKTGDGTLILSGVNSWEGATEVLAGMLRIDGDSSAVTGDLTVSSGATLAGTGSYGGTATIADGGTLLGRSGETLTLGGLTLNAGSILGTTLGAAGTTGQIPLVQVDGDLTLDGTLNITEDSTVGAFGGGVYRLIDYTGVLTDNGLEFGAVPTGVNLNELGVQTSVAGQVNVTYAALSRNFWQGGDGVWSADPAGSGWADTTGVLTGSWQGELAVFAGGGGTVTVDDVLGSVTFNALQFVDDGYTITGDALVTNTAGTTLRVGDGTTAGEDSTATIASAITGTGGIDKTDYGTLVLTGTNSYAGTTRVSTGTLLINGDSSAVTGDLSVASGATLGGSGTYGGAVSVADGGMLSGRSGQTLTTGSLSLSNGSIINAALGAASTDALFQVNGDLTLDGTLNVTDAGGFGFGLYRLVSYTGSLTDNGLTIGLTPTGARTRDIQISTGQAGQVDLIYTDNVTPLPNWTGGSGVWSAAATPANWSNGGTAGGWRPGLALFTGTAGVVTVDTDAGAIEATGIQFAADGYRVEGDALTLTGGPTTIRVGDGTAASAAWRATIASVLTGAGGLVKDDHGTLVLTGTNTYTGGTTLAHGVLEVTSNANLGAASGGLTFDGGTLRLTQGFTTSRAVTFEDEGGTIDLGANDATFSGVFSGAGDFYKTGSGLLTLSGNNVFTGETRIGEGGIRLNNSSLADTIVGQGASLSGVGTIRGDLTNHGLISPGSSPGTLTVNGNFVQSATGAYLVELASASSYDRLVVNGTATLAGTLGVTGLGEFTPLPGQTFTILTAAGGVSGAFDTVTSDWDALSAMLRFTAEYDANAVTVELVQLPFAGVAGATANQAAVGSGVDGAIEAGSITALQSALNSLTEESQVLSALTQLSPQRFERWFGQAVSGTNATLGAIEGRLAETATGRHAGVWFEILHRETRFDATPDLERAEGRADGLVIGGDSPLTSRLQVGAALSYAEETLDLDEVGSVSEGERFGASLYARFDARPVVVEAAVGGAFGQFDTLRAVDIPGYARVAESDTNTTETFASLRVLYPLQIGTARVTPYGGLRYVDWSADGFTERDAALAGLTVDEQAATSLASRLGVTLSAPFESGGLTIAPSLDLSWRHEFEDDARLIGASIGGSPFTVQADEVHSDGFAASVGLDVASGSRWTVYGRVTGEWDTSVDESIDARIGVEFRF